MHNRNTTGFFSSKISTLRASCVSSPRVKRDITDTFFRKSLKLCDVYIRTGNGEIDIRNFPNGKYIVTDNKGGKTKIMR